MSAPVFNAVPLGVVIAVVITIVALLTGCGVSGDRAIRETCSVVTTTPNTTVKTCTKAYVRVTGVP